MSVRIQLESGEFLSLYENASIQFHLKSTLFQERIEAASRSYNFTAPAEPNAKHFNFANELNVRERKILYPVKVYLLDNFWKNAQLEITNFTEREFTFRLLIDRSFLSENAGKSLRSFQYKNPLPIRFYKNALPYSEYRAVDNGVTGNQTVTCTLYLTYSSTPIIKVFNYNPSTKTIPQLVQEINAWINEYTLSYHYYSEVSQFFPENFFIYNLTSNTNSGFYISFTTSDIDLEVLAIGNFNKSSLECYRALISNAIVDANPSFVVVPVYAPDFYSDGNVNYKSLINPLYPKVTGHPVFTGNLANITQPIVPFPMLKHLLYELMEELDMPIESDQFFDDELSKLILFNHEAINSTQRFVRNGWRYNQTGVVYFNDIVPDISLNTLLNDLKQYFNLLFDFNSRTNSVRFIKVENLFNESSDDWTAYLLKEWSYRHEPLPYGLQYTWVEEPLSTELLPVIEDKWLDEEVDFKASLPVTPFEGKIIALATKENNYYRYIGSWLRYAENLYDHNTEAPKKLVTGCSPLFTTVPEYTKPDVTWPHDVKWLLPYTKQPGNMLASDKVPAPHRYLIFRGWQDGSVKATAESEFVAAEYVFASSHNYDMNGNKIGEYSLAWDAEDGVYKKFWKKWLTFLANSSPVMMEFSLPTSILFNLDIKRKKLVNGIEYFIDEFEFDVDTKVSTVRCKMYPITKTT